ncbi:MULTISPECIES: 6-phosphogluconolactonase [unclassified Pseudomonas]|uniref:6-phosphogluconolactonase n=1 Tax=Pseudomonas TaxID=286 RepID=UPI0011A03D21|nr:MULTISPECIES: 6-phosphogluconolactonase [unclassified Pseudomonas]MBU0526057.1 6-phosphogluconolactonase [Gammaproteobacteria bacterium]MBU0821329.1 6-phosphogluconolactonase [Gammaproteobacteria bacterium]MBU0840446.1 6-phosphogluconolactonase [Gammaproteobacteria bacterium]MBU1841542.1 6-phosphogluconolactonase [Gammaproteobacteria bacterium]MDI1329623.1 6-phosphogluconolactonase [Pseudomonas sp.]
MAISELKLPQGVSAHEFKSPVLLADGLALIVAKQLSDAIDARGSATLVVSGGRSPVAFFQNLAKQKLDWSKVVVTLADERWVPVEHADSNAGLLKRYLLQGPAAKAQFLSLYSATANLELAAEQADRLLAELPPIDVLILGMGDDGHTASLFPNSPNLADALKVDGTRRCYPMLAPTVPHQRLTMSRALLASAKTTVLSISGQSKLTTLSAALAGDDVAAMPIRAFLQPTLEIYWCP